MNEIPLESGPPRLEPVFSPPPPIRASAARFDDQLRRAESAPRIDTAAPPDGGITQSEPPDGSGNEHPPVKLRARHPKRVAKNVKESSPDGVQTVLHATRNPTRAPDALPSDPIDVAPQVPTEPFPQPPLRFNIEAFTGTTQKGAYGTPSPVTSTEPLSLVTVVAPIAPCDALEVHSDNATSIDAIDPLRQSTQGVVPITTSRGPSSPAQSHDALTEDADRKPKESLSSRAAEASVDFAEDLLKHQNESLSAANESSLTQLPDGDSGPPDITSLESKDGADPYNPVPSDPAPATAHPADARSPKSIGEGLTSGTPSQRADSPTDARQEVDRVRFVQRVSRAFQSLGNQEGHVRLRLSPPSLGALTLEVTLRGGEMVARLETETAAAKNLLLDSLPALRERLSQHEVRIARFDVDLADHTGGGPARRHAHPDDVRRRPNMLGRSAPASIAPSAAAAPHARRSSVTNAVSLDVLI